MIALWTLAALAGPPPEDEAPDVRIIVGGTFERWEDTAIATVYKGGGWLGSVGVVAPLKGSFRLHLEASWRRITDDATTFDVAPLTALAEFARPGGSDLEWWLAAGPAITSFSEQGGPAKEGRDVVHGAKICGELRAGLRFDTGLVQRPMPPAQGGPFEAIELEIYAGRRQQLPRKEGFDLSAWRLGAALSLRI